MKQKKKLKNHSGMVYKGTITKALRRFFTEEHLYNDG